MPATRYPNRHPINFCEFMEHNIVHHNVSRYVPKVFDVVPFLIGTFWENLIFPGLHA